MTPTPFVQPNNQPPPGAPIGEAENPQAAPDTGRTEQAAAAAATQQPQPQQPPDLSGGEAEQQTTQPTTHQQPEQEQQPPGDIPPGLWDGRTLRQSQRGSNAQAAAPSSSAAPAPWYHQVRDKRDFRGQQPSPSPTPAPDTKGGDHIVLMQRSITHTGAASRTDPFPPNVRRAILTQLQVIRDTANSLPGADLLVAMTDIAAQLVHSVPAAAAAAARHSPEQPSETLGRRGRKRPLTEPNALAEIMRYAAGAGGETEPLPPSLMAEDLFFLIAELEAGALQLHEP